MVYTTKKPLTGSHPIRGVSVEVETTNMCAESGIRTLDALRSVHD